MRIERRLETTQFLDELKNLRIMHYAPHEALLEHLEAQRILIPRLRLRYPDNVERRWFEAGKPSWKLVGRKEPNGPRWRAACALEKARLNLRESGWLNVDPLKVIDPLDYPKSEWRQFIQHPSRRKFVPWADFRVRVDGKKGGPRWHSQTVVTYYSSWQSLLFLECHNMGMHFVGNTENIDLRAREIPETWRSAGVNLDEIRTVRAFRGFQRQFDAVVWFTEEEARNDQFVLRHGYERRLIEDAEREEMEWRRLEVSRRCRKRFRVNYPQIIALVKFLCRRWDYWNSIGYSNHVKAYKKFLAKAIGLARLLGNVNVDQLISDVGRVTGHLKPTIRVIFQDWATEWREDAARILIGFSKPRALLKADFSISEVNAFLDLVEANDLFEFYWRWKSLNERAFSGDANLMAGLKSDLQGMALSVEHIVDAMLQGRVAHPKTQLFEKFKQLWPPSTEVGALLKQNEYRQVAFAKETIDLDWHSEKQDKSDATKIASDLAICHAVRGSAHSKIREQNQLRIERMSLVLLRGVMYSFRQRNLPL